MALQAGIAPQSQVAFGRPIPLNLPHTLGRFYVASYNIAVIRGDGVGVEVIEEGLKVLRAVGRQFEIDWNFVEHPWGSDYYFEHGEMMPPDALDRLAESDSIYLGAVGHPGHTGPRYAQRPAAADSPHVRPVRLRTPQRALPRRGIAAARQSPGRHRHGRHQGEHRGRIRRRWRLSVRRFRRGSRHPGRRLHPPRLRARDNLRVRAGPQPGPRAARHLDHQVQRPGLRDDRVGQGRSTQCQNAIPTCEPSRC